MQKALKLIEIKNVSKTFSRPDKPDLLVLDNISINVFDGEIVAILGRSGSGKSTLLRIMAGLIPPSSGIVLFKNSEVTAPVRGLSMVFQTFALMPWLTVLQNVELGLEALGVPTKERNERALKAIDMIGLDGFESAFPKELSGGMQQRVGLARALVVNPEVLLMDEAFSALDVLTAENLRGDVMDLWHGHKTNIKAIVLVTHKIEEAIAMADRVLLFDSSPGLIKAELPIDLPHPRSTHDKRFVDLVARVYSILIAPTETEYTTELSTPHEEIDMDYRLPDIELTQLFGLIKAFETDFKDKKVSLNDLAAKQKQLSDDELSPLFVMLDILDILHFARLSPGSIELTTTGHQFANSDIQEKKQIFSQQLLLYVPLAAYIKRILNENPNHTLKQEDIMELLESYFDKETAQQVFETIIDWGRYAEIFSYNADRKTLNLDNP